MSTEVDPSTLMQAIRFTVRNLSALGRDDDTKAKIVASLNKGLQGGPSLSDAEVSVIFREAESIIDGSRR